MIITPSVTCIYKEELLQGGNDQLHLYCHHLRMSFCCIHLVIRHSPTAASSMANLERISAVLEKSKWNRCTI